MVKKQICIIIVMLFSVILYASEKKIYKAKLISYPNNKDCGFIDIPYNAGNPYLVINPPEILAQIDKKHENSFRLKPNISQDCRNNFYDDTSSFSIPMPDEKEPLKFFIKFPMDSGYYYKENFLIVDSDNNPLQEGNVISITREYQVFKDPFGGELFIKLTTPGVREDLDKQIKSGSYKIILSNGKEISIGEENSIVNLDTKDDKNSTEIVDEIVDEIENNSINQTNKDLNKQIKSGYCKTILSSEEKIINEEEINIGEENSIANSTEIVDKVGNHTINLMLTIKISSYMSSIFAVLLLLGVTNFCSYKIGMRNSIPVDVNTKK